MNKLFSGALLFALTALATVADAQDRPSPKPVFTLAPTFDCGATPQGTTGTAVVTKANAATLDKTKDVVVTIHTPSGNVTATTCGSAFSSNAVGTKVSVPWTVPATSDKSYIYTCSAAQVSTTFACNPVK